MCRDRCRRLAPASIARCSRGDRSRLLVTALTLRWGAEGRRALRVAPKGSGRALQIAEIPERILQCRADGSTYGPRFPPKRRCRDGSPLFPKIVFDKGGDPAY